LQSCVNCLAADDTSEFEDRFACRLDAQAPIPVVDSSLGPAEIVDVRAHSVDIDLLDLASWAGALSQRANGGNEDSI
jgi:hypothetical protein